MIEIENTYELLGLFIPFFASFMWVFLLVVSLYDSKTQKEQQIKRVSLLFFATFSLGCLLPMLAAYCASVSKLLDMLMLLVLAWLPIIGCHLVWCMTNTDNLHSFRCAKHYILPLVCVLLLIIIEPPSYTYMIVASFFAICYLSLSLIRIRKYWRALDAKTREGTNAKRWYQFATKVALVITLSGVIILFPIDTTFLFVIYLVLMLSFILISSYLCYCSVFLGLAQFENAKTTDQSTELVAQQHKRSYRRIAKVSKNANGRMEMEPLTRKRFDECMKRQKPYLDSDFKMTDLEEALSVNRTVISNFVNHTYGMNFNRYINHLRIQEVERLQKLPQNKKYSLSVLVRNAGFNAMRNYTRALVIEKEETQNEEK